MKSEPTIGEIVSPMKQTGVQKDGSNNGLKRNKLGEFFGFLVSVLGLAASVFAFFPHLTVSEPIQMNSADLFSYKMTVTNEGILPVFHVVWGLAPKIMETKTSSPPGQEITGEAFALYPNFRLIGPEDYSFQLQLDSTSHAGTLSPGDGYTFTTEGLLGSTPGAVARTVDFAIAISYIPVFPPVPMQTCTHFRIFEDRQGGQHWFRAPDTCNRFPWLHHWFSRPTGQLEQ